MYIYTPANPNGLVVVADARLKRDSQIQEQEGGVPVLEDHGFLQRALGKAEWARTTRIALYDYREDLNALTPEHQSRIDALPEGKKRDNLRRTLIANQRREVKAGLIRELVRIGAQAVLVMQSLAAHSKTKEEDPLENAHGTMCWEAFNAPDSFSSMQGTCWDTHGFSFGPVVPFPNPLNYEHVFGWLFRRWARMGLDIAAGKVAPLACPVKVSDPGHEMVAVLAKIQAGTGPLAVDIESYSPKNLITAVGLSDGHYTVSIPWESFIPYGKDTVEPGYAESAQGFAVKQLLASARPKIFHNYSYDVPFLESKDAPVRGEIYDTMALHHEVYRQFRRGLQAAAAQEFCIRPWKSLWNPKVKGLTRDDADYWILDPLKLRDYNCDDAFVTWKLAESLSWKCGVKIQ